MKNGFFMEMELRETSFCVIPFEPRGFAYLGKFRKDLEEFQNEMEVILCRGRVSRGVVSYDPCDHKVSKRYFLSLPVDVPSSA